MKDKQRLEASKRQRIHRYLSGLREDLVEVTARRREAHDDSQSVLPPQAYRLASGSLTEIHAGEAEESEAETGFLGQLGTVSIGGYTFLMEQPGLYRFYRVGDFNRQVLVPHGDLICDLQALVQAWRYGTWDELPSAEAGLQALSRRIVVAGCHDLSVLAVAALNQMGYQARIVAGISAPPWNGLDDGHTLVEVWHGTNGWCIFDPSFARLLPACDIRNTSSDALSAEAIVLSVGEPHWGFRSSRFDFSFDVDRRLGDTLAMRKWYERVLRIPLHMRDGRFFFDVGAVSYAESSLLKSRGYMPVSSDFIERNFYEVQE